MTTRVLELCVRVVYSDHDLNTLFAKTKGEAAATAAEQVMRRIREGIPPDWVCSVAVAEEDGEYEDDDG